MVYYCLSKVPAAPHGRMGAMLLGRTRALLGKRTITVDIKRQLQLHSRQTDSKVYEKPSVPRGWSFDSQPVGSSGAQRGSSGSKDAEHPRTKWASYSLSRGDAPQSQRADSSATVESESPAHVAKRGDAVTNKEVRSHAAAPAAATASGASGAGTTVAKKPRRKLRPKKALIKLSPNALVHLRALLDQPEPQLIRIGVRNRGCSGLTYDLQYIKEPGEFDEVIEQDGVKVVIDSKALFSIVGSEMDWIDDKLSSRFVFKNPNSKGTCGCGESFMV
ncbi:AaceriAGL033Cp [[Ashbya] aceris (nom. inval.)]|nr:AaceriAGL033Cp [[Ashbya] aceris (nom. inval.)]